MLRRLQHLVDILSQQFSLSVRSRRYISLDNAVEKKVEPISVIDIPDTLRIILPTSRTLKWKGKRWVSPLIFIPAEFHVDNDPYGKKLHIDWKEGLYVPAYLLYAAIGIISKDMRRTVNAMPPLADSGIRFSIKRNGQVLNFSRFPVWYDTTEDNTLAYVSYEDMIILPLFSEHDVEAYREARSVVPSQKGIIDPIHTPESKKMGLHLFKAVGSKYDEEHFRLVYV